MGAVVSTSVETARAFMVACVTCAAKPGEPCIVPGGLIVDMHMDRIFASRLSSADGDGAASVDDAKRRCEQAARASGISVPDDAPPLTFARFLDEFRAWSLETFGPNKAPNSVTDHIRKELIECEADPADVVEWADVVMLALDGAWRFGGVDGTEFAAILSAKLGANRMRRWPDWRWRSLPPDAVMEHVRDNDTPPFTPTEREACMVAADALPPRAAAKVREHLIRCAPKHGVEPGQTRPGVTWADHLDAADRHFFKVARMGAPGWDPGAVDDEGLSHLDATIARLMLARDKWLEDLERADG